MRRTRFDNAPCPIARTADLLADWWTPLVLRELFAGRRRFDELADALGISRAVLAQRLNRLVDDGVVERHQYSERPIRSEYRLTSKGRALWPVLSAMWRFGEDWMFTDGAPVELVDSETGEQVRPLVIDEVTGRPVAEIRSRVRRRNASYVRSE